MKLVVRERTKLGSAETRRLRKQGLIPGVLYGRGKTPHAICVPERELRAALTGEAGLHAILDVVLEGQSSTHPSVLKEYQQDVVRGGITHIDLHEVRLDQPITATVAVTLVGDSVGAREGGVLQQVTREVNVEALPMEIPEHLEVDVSELALHEAIRVRDLAQSPKWKAVTEGDTMIVHVVTIKAEAEPAPAEAAVATAAAPAEPEVIKKGKKEEEGAEAAPAAAGGKKEKK